MVRLRIMRYTQPNKNKLRQNKIFGMVLVQARLGDCPTFYSFWAFGQSALPLGCYLKLWTTEWCPFPRLEKLFPHVWSSTAHFLWWPFWHVIAACARFFVAWVYTPSKLNPPSWPLEWPALAGAVYRCKTFFQIVLQVFLEKKCWVGAQ